MAVQFWWNQGITPRKKIFAFRNAYHGDTFGSDECKRKICF